MAVWRVTITKVNGWRAEKLPESVKVEVKPAILEAKAEKAGNAELLRVDYRLSAKYEPKAGLIEVEGAMYLVGVDPEKVLKDGGITDPEIVRQVYQRMFLEPMVLAIGMAKEMLLPLPVRMPEVRVEKKEKK